MHGIASKMGARIQPIRAVLSDVVMVTGCAIAVAPFIGVSLTANRPTGLRGRLGPLGDFLRIS